MFRSWMDYKYRMWKKLRIMEAVLMITSCIIKVRVCKGQSLGGFFARVCRLQLLSSYLCVHFMTWLSNRWCDSISKDCWRSQTSYLVVLNWHKNSFLWVLCLYYKMLVVWMFVVVQGSRGYLVLIFRCIRAFLGRPLTVNTCSLDIMRILRRIVRWKDTFLIFCDV